MSGNEFRVSQKPMLQDLSDKVSLKFCVLIFLDETGDAKPKAKTKSQVSSEP